MARLQGGMPAAGAVAGAVVEIACDESGFSGTNLLDPASPVITHASVDLSVDEAVGVIAGLRAEFQFSPHEFKSGPFLRGPRAGEALGWLLAGLAGRAHVHLVDKEFFLATRMVDMFLAEPSYAAGTRLTQQQRPAALALYRAGRSATGDWNELLAAFVDTVRTKRRRPPDDQALQRFLLAWDRLAANTRSQPPDRSPDITAAHAPRPDGATTHDPRPNGIAPIDPNPNGATTQDPRPNGIAAIDPNPNRATTHDPRPNGIAALDRDRVSAVLVRLHDGDPAIPPPLEPLLPALAETVLFWSDRRRRVLVTHDEQSALTAGRLRRLQQVLAGPAGGLSPLAGLVMADSRGDPRVQVADLLAGMARRLPHLADDGPPRPFVSPTSLRASP